MPSNSAFATTDPYVYLGHETVPKNVTRVIVHGSVRVIPDRAFKECHDLKEVILPEGLVEIGYEAFCGCESLEDVINFPLTLRAIEAYAFLRCSSLVRVDFNEGLLKIGWKAFDGCRSILHLKIPSTVTTIDGCAFQHCSALKYVHLCEGILTIIAGAAFAHCYSLLCINIPSSVTTIGGRAFEHCKLLRNVSITPDSSLGPQELERSHLLLNQREMECSLDLVKGRFNDLPLHRICFYRTASRGFLEEAKDYSTKGRLTQVDYLGMAPLHIISCSGRHDDDVELYKFFVGNYPEALLIKDKWGQTPLFYALLSEAPREIIHFLFEEHSQSLNGCLPFNFRLTLDKIAKKKGTSVQLIQIMIQAQMAYFPNLDVGWRRLVNDNLEGKMPVKMFRMIVEASISKRSNCMSLEHQLVIDSLINEVDARSRMTRKSQAYEVEVNRRRRGDSKLIILRIRDYVQQHREFLKEATTMLELALWKLAINEWKTEQGSNKEGNLCRKGTIINSTEVQNNCRVQCKAEDIICLVLSFL